MLLWSSKVGGYFVLIFFAGLKKIKILTLKKVPSYFCVKFEIYFIRTEAELGEYVVICFNCTELALLLHTTFKIYYVH